MMTESKIAEKTEYIKKTVEKTGTALDDEQARKLLSFYEMLIERNRVTNLTAITEFEDVVKKHFADSLLPAAALDFGSAESAVDIGSGAGFPGIVLKIAFPGLKVTLVDSLGKRVSFLNEVTGRLGLSGLRAVHARAEDLARDERYREQFDLCTSRAVAAMPVLCEYGLPFVKPGGKMVCYKSADAREEITSSAGAAARLGGRLCETESIALPGTDAVRLFAVIEKERPTPAAYPRKAGIPAKKPLS